jgi:hypothetical protein
MIDRERDTVLSFLKAHGVLETRSRETASGVSEYIQDAAARMHLAPLEDSQILEILRNLQAQDLVVCGEAVHPHDSSEYILSWRLVVSS